MSFFKTQRKSLLLLCALITCTFTTPVFSKTKTFTFTAIPDQEQRQLRERFDRVATYFAEHLSRSNHQNIEVKYIPVKSYSAAITAFRNNQVQLAWFGGLSGVRARQLVPQSSAIAQGEEDQHFVTYFIAHHSSGLEYSKQFPAGIKGKTFTFGSKGSTSGRLMPEFHIREFFQDSPQNSFKRVGFSGDHTMTINQVQAGSYQVGAVNFQVWKTMLAAGKIDQNKVKVIWQTPEYPDYQWTIRADVDAKFGAGFKAQIRDLLLTMKDPELLKQFPRTRFVAASNEDYQPILNTAKAIGLL